MAGTIFGLPLSQRVDLNGKPSVGWLLYLYQANTSTPVNSYQDTALTALNPWPIAADSQGMMRQFWLADGSYRARATNADGSITYFDQPSVLALGPSAGAAPSGGVDPNAIFATGDVIWLDKQGTKNGWVRDNGRTIGNATSGASERAHADCQPLYEYLWNTFDNLVCPVSGGRGASAVADFNAPKQLALPDRRGYIAGGLDDMGNAPAGRLAGVPLIYGTVTTPGGLIGETSHALTPAESPKHTHTGTTGLDSVDHTHTQAANGTTGGQYAAGPGANPTVPAPGATSIQSTKHTHAFTTDAMAAGDGPHNNVQRTVLGTFYRKL